jgi:D-cysteine desulfhydrase
MTEQPVTPYVAQTLRYHALLGTSLMLADDYVGSTDIADQLAEHHPTGGERLYRIPWGGSSPLGTLGFVNAAFELADQCGDVAPDVIYVACGTMGTVAGLALGLRLAGLTTQINAVSVVPPSLTTADGIAGLFVAANRKLNEIDTTIPLLDDPLVNITLRDEFFGNGYAEATAECTQAVALIRNTEGFALETTYTGKAVAALIHDARCQRLAGQQIVFWNTYNARPYPEAVNTAPGTSLPDWAQRYLSTTAAAG